MSTKVGECPQCHRADGMHKLGCGERFGVEQREPSDASVRAALAEWERPVNLSPLRRMRAALRAAAEVGR